MLKLHILDLVKQNKDRFEKFGIFQNDLCFSIYRTIVLGKFVSMCEYFTFDEDIHFNMPVITLEVLSTNLEEPTMHTEEQPEEMQDAGIHFLTDAQKNELLNDVQENEQDPATDINKAPTDFLEYMTRHDGSVVCKLCGEILQSRTHWYRHKYKHHVIQPLNPAPLFQCEQCLLYFKSRKGYIGHIASKHSEELNDATPVLTNSQICPMEPEGPIKIKEEPDPELVIPKTTVPNYQNTTKQTTVKSEPKKERHFRNAKVDNTDKAEWERRRLREEKLVADIIDRVRKECEAQGSGAAARRGYTRKTTVMNT